MFESLSVSFEGCRELARTIYCLRTVPFKENKIKQNKSKKKNTIDMGIALVGSTNQTNNFKEKEMPNQSNNKQD